MCGKCSVFAHFLQVREPLLAVGSVSCHRARWVWSTSLEGSLPQESGRGWGPQMLQHSPPEVLVQLCGEGAHTGQILLSRETTRARPWPHTDAQAVWPSSEQGTVCEPSCSLPPLSACFLRPPPAPHPSLLLQAQVGKYYPAVHKSNIEPGACPLITLLNSETICCFWDFRKHKNFFC